MMKLGDRFKDKTTGKIYIIRSEIDNDTLCLEGENGLGRRLTGRQSLKRTCEKLEDITSWSRTFYQRTQSGSETALPFCFLHFKWKSSVLELTSPWGLVAGKGSPLLKILFSSVKNWCLYICFTSQPGTRASFQDLLSSFGNMETYVWHRNLRGIFCEPWTAEHWETPRSLGKIHDIWRCDPVAFH